MTSIEWGISISNQRWGERVSGRERERETKRGTFSCVWRIRERGEHFKRFEGKQKWKKDRTRGKNTRKETMCTSDSGENPANAECIWPGIFLLFTGCSSTSLFFTLVLICSFSMAQSLTRILTTAETHQNTKMQLKSPREQIFNKLYACQLIHIFASCAIII